MITDNIFNKFKFKPSKYQTDIINTILNTNENILVDAKAGSGKTSTLLLIAECLKLQNKKSLFLAFNKSIVEELKVKVDTSYCNVKTVHSLGFSYISSYLYSKYGKNYEIIVDDKYFHEILEYYFNELCYEQFAISMEASCCDNLKELKVLKNNLIDALEKVANFVRFYNIDYYNYEEVERLAVDVSEECKNAGIYGMENYKDVIRISLDRVLTMFNNPEFNEAGIPIIRLNFTDMIWFPCIYNMRTPYSFRDIQNILVDEAQDINVLEQLLIKRFLLNNLNTRFIFVGDKFQSIYAFAGADTHSIENIQKSYNLKSLPLNICYRCPEKIINLAKEIVPSIECNKERKDLGEVYLVANSQLHRCIDKDSIIVGRFNSTLLRIFRDLTLKRKIPVKFMNKELVNTIINSIKVTIDGLIIRYKTANIFYQPILDIYSEKPYLFEGYPYNKCIQDIKDRKFDLYRESKKYTLQYLQYAINEYKCLEKLKYTKVFDEKPICKNQLYLLTEEMKDLMDVISSFIEEFNNFSTGLDNSIDGLITYISSFLRANDYKNVTILSSIHKMKGGEGKNVLIYDYNRFPYTWEDQTDAERQQEINLQYVAITRAKERLYLCLDDSEEESYIKSKQAILNKHQDVKLL